VKGFMESMLTSKRYLVPLTVVEPVATAAVFVAYMGGGRFAMPKGAPVLSLRGGFVDPEFPAMEEDLPTPAAVVKTSFSAANAALLLPNP
jgi:hypothetical protein